MLAFTLEAAPGEAQPVSGRCAEKRDAAAARGAIAAQPEVRPLHGAGTGTRSGGAASARRGSERAEALSTATGPRWSPSSSSAAMAKMLAQHCELKSHRRRAHGAVRAAEHKHLAEKSYQDKLKTALESFRAARFS